MTPPFANLAQGRIAERVPVAVIDIGSNSVRQVIYEGLSRAPAVLFNEKVLCGLGRGLLATGRLHPDGVRRASAAIRRFIALGRQIGVSHTFILATAAARDAKNGSKFIAKIEEIAGTKVEILTGSMEAYYSALGIKNGFFSPCGIVGDMGGGSLELIGIDQMLNADDTNASRTGTTLPLGGLWLQEASGGSLSKAKKIVREQLKRLDIPWPDASATRGRVFYCVGGTWRSLAKLHIAHSNHPMPGVHEYEMPAKRIAEFCRDIVKDHFDEDSGLVAVSKKRRDLLPFGAIVLREIIRHFKPDMIAFSSLGVREGLLYSRLEPEERKRDSLLCAAKDLSVLRARSPEHGIELAGWTEMAFAELGIEESQNERRYRLASCYLADLGWRAHPDFRAKQAQEIIANAGFVSIDHEGRAYLALANYHRYMGFGSTIKPLKISRLATTPVRKKARILAAMFRILYLFSASMPGIIPQIKLRKTGPDSADLIIPEKIADLAGERPDARIRQFGKQTGFVLIQIIA